MHIKLNKIFTFPFCECIMQVKNAFRVKIKKLYHNDVAMEKYRINSIKRRVWNKRRVSKVETLRNPWSIY